MTHLSPHRWGVSPKARWRTAGRRCWGGSSDARASTQLLAFSATESARPQGRWCRHARGSVLDSLRLASRCRDRSPQALGSLGAVLLVQPRPVSLAVQCGRLLLHGVVRGQGGNLEHQALDRAGERKRRAVVVAHREVAVATDEHREVTWKRLKRNPLAATPSIAGVSMSEPKQPSCAKPRSSRTISTTCGAPAGGRSGGSTAAVNSAIVRPSTARVRIVYPPVPSSHHRGPAVYRCADDTLARESHQRSCAPVPVASFSARNRRARSLI